MPERRRPALSGAGAAGIRALELSDLDRVDQIHARAFELPGALGSPFFRGRVELALRTDPLGAFVAVGARGRVHGVAVATRREGLWGLSLLAVDPAVQGRGVGASLLRESLGYAEAGDARMVLASHDERAQHLYARAGFTPRPTVAVRGVVGPRRPRRSPRLRAGSVADLPLCEAVDRRIRGFARSADLVFLLDAGARLWTVDDAEGQGYALCQPERVTTLCATDAATATALLSGALAGAGTGEFEVAWLTEGQRWAYPLLFAVGLDAVPWGPIWVAGPVGPLVPYVPSGSLL